MSDLIYVSIISGCFGVIFLLGLTLSWRYKLKLTMEAEEIKKEQAIQLKNYDLKMAKLRNPTKIKRLPRGYQNQLMDMFDLLGDERVQEMMTVLQGKLEDIRPDNKLINTLMQLAPSFLEGLQRGTQTKQEIVSQV